MKKQIKKITVSIGFIVLVGLIYAFDTKKAKSDDGYYAFIVVDGVYNDNVGYCSNIIYFKGYEDCDNVKNTEFFGRAKRSFSNHLKAYHTEAFPYGENNNFKIIDMKRHSTSTYLKTRNEAEERMIEWVAEQKGKDYDVIRTNFNYSCNN